jgi:hypothetical protein
MDSDYTYQSSFIWKSTVQDGLLPVTNYTEEIKDQEKSKKSGGLANGQGTDIGVVTNFENQEDEEREEEGEDEETKDKSLVPGSYIYLGLRQHYAIVRNRLEDSKLLIKIRKPGFIEPFNTQLTAVKSMDGHEEIEVDIAAEEVKTEVEVKVRVIMSEDKRFTVSLKRPANDKMKVLADELGELLNLSRYALTFFYRGDMVALNERIGDREIGGLA